MRLIFSSSLPMKSNALSASIFCDNFRCEVAIFAFFAGEVSIWAPPRFSENSQPAFRFLLIIFGVLYYLLLLVNSLKCFAISYENISKGDGGVGGRFLFAVGFSSLIMYGSISCTCSSLRSGVAAHAICVVPVFSKARIGSSLF